MGKQKMRKFSSGATRNSVERRIKVALIAGFYNGEGSVCCTSNNGNPYTVLRFSIAQKDYKGKISDTLKIVKAVVKCGGIYRKTRIGKEINQHQFYISKVKDVKKTLQLVYPYLSRAKKTRQGKHLVYLKKVKKYYRKKSVGENMRKKRAYKGSSNNLKNTNPKDLIGSDKLPLHLFPMTATVYGTMALLDGALKYGRANWRSAGVRASIYYDACLRHLTKWFEGETIDSDSGLPHLSHALACIAILIDAVEANKLKDDRMYKGGYLRLVKKFAPDVKRLKKLHKAKNPKHWTIADKKG